MMSCLGIIPYAVLLQPDRANERATADDFFGPILTPEQLTKKMITSPPAERSFDSTVAHVNMLDAFIRGTFEMGVNGKTLHEGHSVLGVAFVCCCLEAQQCLHVYTRAHKLHWPLGSVFVQRKTTRFKFKHRGPSLLPTSACTRVLHPPRMGHTTKLINTPC